MLIAILASALLVAQAHDYNSRTCASHSSEKYSIYHPSGPVGHGIAGRSGYLWGSCLGYGGRWDPNKYFNV